MSTDNGTGSDAGRDEPGEGGEKVTLETAAVGGANGEPDRDEVARKVSESVAAAAKSVADEPGAGTTPDNKPRGERQSDDRIDIRITADFHECVDAAVKAMVGHSDVYERGNMLVQVVRKEADDQPDAKGVKRLAGTPMIVTLRAASARTLVSRLARFWGFDARAKKWVRKPPPKDVAEAVLALGSYPGSRPLTGIVEAPTLKPDGSILTTPGYDADTGLLYLPSADYPDVPDSPSMEDVKRATDHLLYLVQDFPFESETDKAAWLVLVLTLVARGSLACPVPAFLVSANVAGSGKSVLAAVASKIATGRLPAYDGYAYNDDEMEKRLGVVAMVGDPMVLFDNAANGSSVGSPALDRAIKCPGVYRARLLGKSEFTPPIPWRTVVVVTGNNISTKSDALRRFVPIFLISSMERPEERDPESFTVYKEKELTLDEYIDQERPQLVVDALTILRGYIAAEKPKQGLTAMDFTGWESLVRQAVHYAMSVDPCGSRKRLQDSDETTQERQRVVEAWNDLCMRTKSLDGMTSKDAAAEMNAPGLIAGTLRYPEIREAFSAAIPKGAKNVDSIKLGHILKRHRNARTPIGTLRARKAQDNLTIWMVEGGRQQAPERGAQTQAQEPPGREDEDDPIPF
jgi:hypothetical protein